MIVHFYFYCVTFVYSMITVIIAISALKLMIDDTIMLMKESFNGINYKYADNKTKIARKVDYHQHVSIDHFISIHILHQHKIYGQMIVILNILNCIILYDLGHCLKLIIMIKSYRKNNFSPHKISLEKMFETFIFPIVRKQSSITNEYVQPHKTFGQMIACAMLNILGDIMLYYIGYCSHCNIISNEFRQFNVSSYKLSFTIGKAFVYVGIIKIQKIIYVHNNIGPSHNTNTIDIHCIVMQILTERLVLQDIFDVIILINMIFWINFLFVVVLFTIYEAYPSKYSTFTVTYTCTIDFVIVMIPAGNSHILCIIHIFSVFMVNQVFLRIYIQIQSIFTTII